MDHSRKTNPYLEIAAVIAGKETSVTDELKSFLNDRQCMGDLFPQRYCDVHSLSDSEYAWFALTYLLERHALLIQVTPTMYISDARAKLRTLPLLADASDVPTFEDYGADEDDCIDEWLSIYNEGLEERGYSLVELVDDETEEMHLVCVPLCATEELACLAHSAGQEISRYE